ncbi:3-phosphoshikimate 1-carboxyvinyltransferase [bacterium]|nr:3-phosphoshikimate 1-carboxyvinyltransferase [bacterium]
MIKTITSAEKITGTITPPGDKSISHRAFIIASIAEGESLISGSSLCADVKSTMHCLSMLGVEFQETDRGIIVNSPGIKNFKNPYQVLYAGNSGTTVRLLSGLLASLPFETEITGDSSLRKRPMQRIIDPLKEMGAEISSDNGFLPLKIKGAELTGKHFRPDAASAQVKSCILLAGINSLGSTVVEEPVQTRDHTERMLPEFNIPVQIRNNEILINGPIIPSPADIQIPGDISSAAFFITAALLSEKGSLTIQNVGLNPGRMGFIDILRKMGANIFISNKKKISNEIAGDITAVHSNLRSIEIGGKDIPRSIDELPIIAVAATQAEGETIIRDAGELRIKETDRIKAVAANLQAMRADVEITKDGLIIPGPQQLKGAVLESYNDHRIAMAFSIAGLTASGRTVIKNAECADISFPGFFSILEDIVHE